MGLTTYTTETLLTCSPWWGFRHLPTVIVNVFAPQRENRGVHGNDFRETRWSAGRLWGKKFTSRTP